MAKVGMEEEHQEAFVPIVRTQCICPPPELIDGVLYEIHDPSCLADGHGCQGHYIPQAKPDRKRHAQHAVSESS